MTDDHVSHSCSRSDGWSIFSIARCDGCLARAIGTVGDPESEPGWSLASLASARTTLRTTGMLPADESEWLAAHAIDSEHVARVAMAMETGSK